MPMDLWSTVLCAAPLSHMFLAVLHLAPYFHGLSLSEIKASPKIPWWTTLLFPFEMLAASSYFGVSLFSDKPLHVNPRLIMIKNTLEALQLGGLPLKSQVLGEFFIPWSSSLPKIRHRGSSSTCRCRPHLGVLATWSPLGLLTTTKGMIIYIYTIIDIYIYRYMYIYIYHNIVDIWLLDPPYYQKRPIAPSTHNILTSRQGFHWGLVYWTWSEMGNVLISFLHLLDGSLVLADQDTCQKSEVRIMKFSPVKSMVWSWQLNQSMALEGEETTSSVNV